MKILLAVDGSTSSDAAVQAVARRPWPAGTHVKLLAVIEMHLVTVPAIWAVPDSHYLDLLNEMQTVARTALDRAVTELQDANATRAVPLVIETDIVHGKIQDMILKEAEAWGADLIMVGSHGHGALGRFLLGSVSQAIISQAHCSVEVVRVKTMA